MNRTAYSKEVGSSPSPVGREPGGGAHVLVIRLSAMGDVAMTVPVLIALKRKYPNVKITVLTKPHFEPIFDSIEGITVFPAHVNSKHKGIFGLWKLYQALKSNQISHVADVHNVLRSKILGFFFSIGGVRVIKVDKGRAEKRKLTQDRNKVFQPLKPTIERYADVFKDLGFEMDVGKNDVLPKHKLSEQLLKFVEPGYNKIIGIAPFATYQSKMYQLDLMEQVIQQLIVKNHKVLLFGGGNKEVDQLKALASKFGDEVQAVAGELNFKEELALISNLNVMVAMDSGNGHLAANYGVPVVTIWGVTHPYAGFAPINQPLENSLLPDREKFPLVPTSVYGNKCPDGYLNAINSITPKQVVKKVLEILGED